MIERIQKVLARAGIGSRRQIEQWIQDGRLSVNGLKPTPGTKIGPRDRVALDGRPIRIHEAKAATDTVLYHRAAKHNLKAGEEAAPTELVLQLPGHANRRWIPLSPLPFGDSGLELLTTDGTLAHALMRHFARMPVEFALRIRGDARLDQLERLRSGVIAEGEKLPVESLELEGGEGVNRWFRLTAPGARARDVHRLCEAAGVQVSRLIRVRIGPLTMDRGLSRGKARELSLEQTQQLYALAELPMPSRSTAAQDRAPDKQMRPGAARAASTDNKQRKRRQPAPDRRPARRKARKAK